MEKTEKSLEKDSERLDLQETLQDSENLPSVMHRGMDQVTALEMLQDSEKMHREMGWETLRVQPAFPMLFVSILLKDD